MNVNLKAIDIRFVSISYKVDILHQKCFFLIMVKTMFFQDTNSLPSDPEAEQNECYK